MAWSLAVALAGEGLNNEKLVAQSLEPVLDAIGDQELSKRHWEQLDESVSSRWWLGSKGQKRELVRAVVERFLEREWRTEYLMKAFRSPAAFKSATRDVRYSPLGRKLKSSLLIGFESVEPSERNDTLTSIIQEVRKW